METSLNNQPELYIVKKNISKDTAEIADLDQKQNSSTKSRILKRKEFSNQKITVRCSNASRSDISRSPKKETYMERKLRLLDEETRRAFGEFNWSKANVSDKNNPATKMHTAEKKSPTSKDLISDELEPVLFKKVKKAQNEAETVNSVNDDDKENDPGIQANNAIQDKGASLKRPFGLSDIENLPKREEKIRSLQLLGSLGDLMAHSKKRLSRIEIEKRKFKEEQEEKRKKELQAIKDKQIVFKLDLSS